MEELSRRVFVSTALATGFALATRPVAASAITTDSEGLTAGDVKIGQLPAYRAMPASAPSGGGKFPVVLVVQEIFGVHEHIKDVCRRLAKLGYFAVAPELYYRQGNTQGMTDFGEILKVVMKVPDAQVMSDLDATAAWANASGKVDGNKLGITGFCWGGRITWLYAAHNPKLKAAVAWYGRISSAPNALQPHHPLDIAKDLKAPVLGLYGAKDEGIPVAHLDLMKREIAAANGKSQIQVYPDAGHAFYADYRKSYEPGSAADGWKRMQDWFKANGVG
jgi:carboxymethylenebutenolidase